MENITQSYCFAFEQERENCSVRNVRETKIYVCLSFIKCKNVFVPNVCAGLAKKYLFFHFVVCELEKN